MKKLLATTAVVVGLSGGALALGLGAGTAGADLPPGAAPPAPPSGYSYPVQGPYLPGEGPLFNH